VHALVVRHGGDAGADRAVDGDELVEWCRRQLAGYKCPRTIEFVSTVGRNAMGKLNKRALRAPYWEQVQR